MNHALKIHHRHEQIEISAALQTFHLPSIHKAIPKIAVLSKFEQTQSEFGLQLLDAGIINPEDIDESIATAHGVIESGLSAWFNQRMGDLNAIKISMQLLNSNVAVDFVEQFEESEIHLTGGFLLKVIGESTGCRELKGRAIALEDSHNGLFKTALNAIDSASCITVGILLPNEIFSYFSYNWEDDGLSIPKDEDVREVLVDRFGDTSEVDNYLPSAIVPLFGGENCLINCYMAKNVLLNPKQLRTFATTTPDADSAAVAIQTALLIDAIKKANDMQAEMPGLAGLYAECVERGCVLIYERDDRVFQVLDEMVECAYNNSEATDCIGFKELPNNAEELREYFAKLDMACTVLRHMDTLISMISTVY